MRYRTIRLRPLRAPTVQPTASFQAAIDPRQAATRRDAKQSHQATCSTANHQRHPALPIPMPRTPTQRPPIKQLPKYEIRQQRIIGARQT